MISRRKFVGLSVVGVSGLVGGAWWLRDRIPFSTLFSSPLPGHPDDPIQLVSGAEQEEFSGDDVHRAHSYLWKKEEWMERVRTLPPSVERARVVVIGGGIAGLTAAYRLRDYRPVVLEQARQFGGNSRGESWEGLPYSIGTAYIGLPDPEAPSTQFLRELGIESDLRIYRNDSGAVIFRGKQVEGFWEGETDPARAEEFRRARALLKSVVENEYPVIPPRAVDADVQERLAKMDSVNFHDWVQDRIGDLHPHVEEFFELYCWSTYCASTRELSAAQVLAFLASDLEGIAVFPGGNSWIAQRLMKSLRTEELRPGLRAQSMVLDVAHQGEKVEITYADAAGELQQIHAEACILAVPKFIAAKLISSPLNPGQLEAMKKIRYRSYLVGNALIRGRVESNHYDSFILRGGLERPVREEALARGFTDVITGAWASYDKPEVSVLTLYHGMPMEDARAQIMGMSLGQARRGFEEKLPEILRLFGVSEDRLAGVRMTRWGHPIPVSEPGLISEGWLERARQPLGGRVFFAQQDNWCSPGYEAAYAMGEEAAASARNILAS